ncbi:MAG: helix-turn-helix domain-containing protein [Magnetococcales bacterium]|nr:helix-turn-helix domain-containing protein [Magnetococcales bacterium]
MSHATLYWAMEQSLPSLTKLTLIMLAKHADQKHQCFPSVDRLARLCQCHRRSISRCLRSLMEAKLVTERKRWRQSGGQTSSLFTLHVTEGVIRPDKKAPGLGVDVTERHDKSYRVVEPDVMHMDDRVSPIYKEEPSTENLNCPQNPPPTPSGRMMRGDTCFAPPIVGSMTAAVEQKLVVVTPPMIGSRVPAAPVDWDSDAAFARFWANYPHKVQYGKARQNWRQLVRTPELATAIIEDVQYRSRYHAPWVRSLAENTLRFIPFPANYLLGERWMDAIEENRHAISGDHRPGNFARVTAKLDELLSRCRSGQGVWGEGIPEGFTQEDSFVLEADDGHLRNAMDLSVW